jgi:rod shape-determining protein MreC
MLVVGLVLASLMTITLDFRAGDSGPLASLGRTALGVVSPLQEAVSNVFRPVADFLDDVTSIGSLRDENERLRFQIQELARERQEVLRLRREIEELNRIFGLSERLQLPTVGAQVIGESPSNFEYSVVIDRGADDGLRIDMPVIGPGGLVGRIIRASDSSSVVLLIIDPESAVSVRLASSGETGVLVGRRGHDLRLDLVDANTTVRAGEPVETSGLGGVFPAGIPVGVVSAATAPEGSLLKQVSVRPNVDFSTFPLLAVVITPVAGEGRQGGP